MERVLALLDAMTDGYPEWAAERQRRARQRRLREDEAFDDHMTGPTGRNIGGIYEEDP